MGLRLRLSEVFGHNCFKVEELSVRIPLSRSAHSVCLSSAITGAAACQDGFMSGMFVCTCLRWVFCVPLCFSVSEQICVSDPSANSTDLCVQVHEPVDYENMRLLKYEPLLLSFSFVLYLCILTVLILFTLGSFSKF